jgi:hypothetical protein
MTMPSALRRIAWIGISACCLGTAVVVAGDPAGPKPDLAPPETFHGDELSHWAYRPVQPVDPPAVKGSAWVRNPIDRFILAGLEEMGWEPTREADRPSLIRRVTYDLTGLPPTSAEVDAFVHDERPGAYERLVDRLLNSPHHGERWGQHWLDLAHYADSNGFELDAERPDAWRYRDWVVRVLNEDVPYDRFVSLQLAGDELSPGERDALIATGFCRCGPREVVGGNVIPEVKRQSELSEITGTVGSVFLGLTIGCARCHDHKYDSIPSTDYYRLQSFFVASALEDVPIASEAERAAFKAAEKAVAARTAPFRKQLAEIEAPYREAIKHRKLGMLSQEERVVMSTPASKRTAAQKRLAQGLQTSLRVTWEDVAAAVAADPTVHRRREDLKRSIDEIERTLPRPPAHAMALVDHKSKASAETFVLRRGDYKNRGPRVAPRPPGVILASQKGNSFTEASIVPAGEKSGRRGALSRWLTRPDNPLTARVIVNRLWQHHFGRGIVATPSDFGVRGEPPSHPELLDWLASELIAGGWRLKPIHRLMVTSSAYRQSSRATRERAADDPENTMLYRMNRRRLDAEGVRDAMLAVSGDLNPKASGPGVLAPIEKEVEDLIFTEAEVVDLWPEDRNPVEHLRRSLYLFRKRNVRYPLFDSFDAPDTQTACPRRETSTHALQALNLLNSDFAAARARSLALRVMKDGGNDADRIRSFYRIVLAREPRANEIDRARAFLKGQAERIGGPGREAATWADLALAMLNSNEFLYVP